MEFVFKSDAAKELVNKVKAKSEKKRKFNGSKRPVSDDEALARVELDNIKRVDIYFTEKTVEDRATPLNTSAPSRRVHTYIRESEGKWHPKDDIDPRTGKKIKIYTRLVFKYITDLKAFSECEVVLTTRQGKKISY